LYDAELGYSQTLKLGRREWPARLNNIWYINNGR
jgi:hypothetical protein